MPQTNEQKHPTEAKKAKEFKSSCPTKALLKKTNRPNEEMLMTRKAVAAAASSKAALSAASSVWFSYVSLDIPFEYSFHPHFLQIL